MNRWLQFPSWSWTTGNFTCKGAGAQLAFRRDQLNSQESAAEWSKEVAGWRRLPQPPAAIPLPLPAPNPLHSLSLRTPSRHVPWIPWVAAGARRQTCPRRRVAELGGLALRAGGPDAGATPPLANFLLICSPSLKARLPASASPAPKSPDFAFPG